ncbi:hypothetical protein CROQUDRAFT_88072 [Cronartium quercuum f. sp. fusiforme G11]|uniref:Uncharacterized protein n=1 Tax=Cronartium quercuum f. sp. fusiforme G11 TaxID=708437 RepID=A0A9P6NNA4_9BASI|nr:hypothetical protein CROQUDRAFT_88072 [Cronartium quercuum f. sp. fusiforme G11]
MVYVEASNQQQAIPSSFSGTSHSHSHPSTTSFANPLSYGTKRGRGFGYLPDFKHESEVGKPTSNLFTIPQ